ncbi:SDR family oxidoreductase [Brooklawnia cerclae]|uniref:NAD(P)H dehydrogenase (Quinone) n=1 Tax=Brooklawnia cerclae TaxID=349934 RepID=A0ABX0SGE0_9ACTN|nr:NAD(P)H-binding protein [Brooklawnia cerclae]NIH57455.1 NAD(P)H dehydrogenase (quinone) [Brooklawnia cerclae]
MSFAVTGATGALGTLVINALADRVPADQIVALVRDLGKAAPLAARGVTVREFDYDRSDTLAPALDSVDRLLLISSNQVGRRFAQHKAVIDAAVGAGVSRIAYTSLLGAKATSNPLASEHVATEDYLAESGVTPVLLRNGWYTENFVGTLHSAAQTGTVLTSAGEGRVASAARADYAEAAAAALAADRPSGIYELSGDVAWTQADLAAAIGEVLGREITVHDVSPAEHASILAEAGVDAGAAGFAVAIDATIAAGELGIVTGDLSRLIGRPTTPLIDTLRAAA